MLVSVSMSRNGVLFFLAFFASIVGAAVLWEVMRFRINRRLPPSERSLVGENYIPLLRLHREQYPDSPLRFWFWAFIGLALGTWILGGYLQLTHR